MTFNDVTPLAAACRRWRKTAARLQLQVKDGKVWMGAPADSAPTHPDADHRRRPRQARDGARRRLPSQAARRPGLRHRRRPGAAAERHCHPRHRHVSASSPSPTSSTRDGGYRLHRPRAEPRRPTATRPEGGRTPERRRWSRAAFRTTWSIREQHRPAVSAGEVGDYTAGQAHRDAQRRDRRRRRP